jgi:choline dehydrogenase-like flavoprotein
MSAIPIKTIRYKSGSAIHYAGTIPMGNDDKFAVNTAGQVKFINNLIIADASIIPRLSSKPISINAATLGDYIVQKNI